MNVTAIKREPYDLDGTRQNLSEPSRAEVTTATDHEQLAARIEEVNTKLHETTKAHLAGLRSELKAMEDALDHTRELATAALKNSVQTADVIRNKTHELTQLVSEIRMDIEDPPSNARSSSL